jgi:hypothetical protein
MKSFARFQSEVQALKGWRFDTATDLRGSLRAVLLRAGYFYGVELGFTPGKGFILNPFWEERYTAPCGGWRTEEDCLRDLGMRILSMADQAEHEDGDLEVADFLRKEVGWLDWEGV